MTLERKRIGIDFDDLIFDLMTQLCLWHNTRYGTANVREDFTTYDIWLIWGVTRDESLRRAREFYPSREHAAMLPLQGAKEVIPMLLEQVDVEVVSSRPELARGETLGLLEEHFPQLVDHLHLTNQYGFGASQRKSEICRTLGLQAFAEDAAHHHQDVQQVIEQTYLYRTPWNSTYAATLPQRLVVSSWYGLGARLIF